MAANSLHHPTTTPKGEATVASDTAPRNDVKTRQTLIRTIDMVRTMADCEPDMLGDLVMFLSAVLMTRRNPWAASTARALMQTGAGLVDLVRKRPDADLCTLPK